MNVEQIRPKFLEILNQEIVNYAGNSYGIRISASFFNETRLEKDKKYDIYFVHDDIIEKKLNLETIKMGDSNGIRIPLDYINQKEIDTKKKYDLYIDLKSKR